jgi:transcriptional regulator with XRE-family HTH domain
MLARVEPRNAPAAADGFLLSQRVRDIRTQAGLTLAAVALRAGLARSTLSKIENDQMSPTFDVLQRLSTGLGVDMDELLSPVREAGPTGRRSITRAKQGQIHDTPTYVHEFLCADLTHKHAVPSKTRIRARSIAEFPDWVRHEGDDFLLVLDGAVELHTEFYEPVVLETGDSIYYDAQMGHLCISVSKQDAVVLWLSVPAAPRRADPRLKISDRKP